MSSSNGGEDLEVGGPQASVEEIGATRPSQPAPDGRELMAADAAQVARPKHISRFVYFGLVGLFALAFAFNTPLLLQDLPDWVLQGQELASRWFHGTPLDPTLHLKHFPVPNSALTVLIALLGSVVGFEVAAKVIVIASLIISAWVIWRFIASLNPDFAGWKSIAALSFIVLSSSTFNGYISYQIGLWVLFAFFAWLISGGRNLSVAALFGVAIFLCHGTAYAIYVLAIVVWALRSRPQRHMIWALLPSLLLVAWYLAGESQLSVSSPSGDFVTNFGSAKEWILYKAYTLAKLGPFHNFLGPDGMPFNKSQPVYALGVATNVAFGLLLACQGVLACKNALKHSTSDTERALATIAVTLLLLFLVLPPTEHKLVNPGERLLIPAVGLLLCLPGLGGRAWQIGALGVIVWLIAGATFFFSADTDYSRVMVARKAYHGRTSGHDVFRDLHARDAGTVIPAGRQLFAHDAYRFFHIYNNMRLGVGSDMSFDTGLLYRPPGLSIKPDSRNQSFGGGRQLRF